MHLGLALENEVVGINTIGHDAAKKKGSICNTAGSSLEFLSRVC